MNSKENSHENIDSLDLAADKSSCDENSRENIILFEYKMLQMYGPLLGIYAIPNLDNPTVWNCIIFVRRGFYKDGKFKFDLIFPLNFPASAPEIVFKTSIFHPLVKQYEGTVDVKELTAEEWSYKNENMLFNVLAGLEKMFSEKSKLQIRHSYNPDAAKALISKPHNFIEKALQCVQNSQQSLYSNEAGTSLIIKKYNNGELEGYKKKLGELCQENRHPEQKRKEFLSYLFEEHP